MGERREPKRFLGGDWESWQETMAGAMSAALIILGSIAVLEKLDPYFKSRAYEVALELGLAAITTSAAFGVPAVIHHLRSISRKQ